MAIAADFSVDRSTGNIRHVSGTSTYTVLAFHRYLSDLMDDATAASDDILDITDPTASDRSTDNIITLLNGYNIDDTAAQFLYDGSITQGTSGAVVYSGLVVVGTLASGNLQIVQNNTLLTDTWTTHLNADSTQNILMRCLVKTRTGSADIDGKRIRVQARTFGYTYAEFAVTMGLGNSTAAIFTASDLNNQTSAATVGAWTLTNTEGYQGIDVNGDSVNENYYSKWDKSVGPRSTNDLYQYAKWLQRDGTASTLYGLGGALFRGITHSIPYTAKTGTPTQNEVVTWGTGATAGSGRVLAFPGTTTGTIWIQLLTGVIVASTGVMTGSTSGATWTAGTAVQRTVSPVFLGQSTGSALIGAFGIGVVASQLTASDLLTDLSGTTYTPPNNVTFTVSGVVSGDRVLVAPWDGTTVDGSGNPVPQVAQLTLSGTLSSGTVTSVVVTGSIPADTPSTGTIRVVNNAGVHIRCAYTSWTGSTFTITSTSFSGSNATSGNSVYISYIDRAATGTSETFTTTYLSSRNLMVRVRNASTPIKTFVTSATLGSAGGSTTAIRTTD